MNLGNKIYELRKEAKFSQEQLAEKIDVTRQTISNWEIGQTVPDIVQAKELSNIFKITLDELIDNDVKDILVEKINNTEKIANNTLKTLKILSIIFIIFLIMVISTNVGLIIKKNNEKIAIQAQKQTEEEAYRKYMDNIQTKRFIINFNDEQYSYSIQYGEDDTYIGDCFTLVNGSNQKRYENYEIFLNYVHKSYKKHSNVKDLINELKQYFEEKGGIWQEIL